MKILNSDQISNLEKSPQLKDKNLLRQMAPEQKMQLEKAQVLGIDLLKIEVY